tara:strand:+ start:470 stop:733 length:264 start_codon:yes stop_codon:yes gene_type:complete
MLQKYIHFKVFIISLAVGLLAVYLYQPDPTIVYVYPTPTNVNNIQLKDNADNCFKFNAIETTCPSDKSKIHNIPVQKKVGDSNTSIF